MDQKHSVVGGSNAYRRIMCPASLRLEAGIPAPDNVSRAATRGSALHALVEGCLLRMRAGGAGHPPDRPLTVRVANEDYRVTGDDLADLAIAVQAWRDFAAAHDAAIVAVEGRYPFPGIEGAFGTADIVWRSRSRAAWGVWDWKFGNHPVAAQDNPQLLFYAAAARAAVKPSLPRGEVVLAIHQPAVSSKPALWATDYDALDDFEETLRQAVKAGLAEDAPAVAGDWCRWARCAPVCPLRRQQAAMLAQALTGLGSK